MSRLCHGIGSVNFAATDLLGSRNEKTKRRYLARETRRSL
jgi:hypothetical protein